MGKGRHLPWLIGVAMSVTVILTGCVLEPSEPAIAVVEPNGGECWLSAGTETVIWSTTGSVGDVMIEFSADGGENWTVLVASTGNDGAGTLSVPDSSSAQCLVRLSEVDGSLSDVSDEAFTVGPAKITMTSPAGGEEWPVGSLRDITWTSFGVENVRIEVFRDGGVSWEEVAASTPASPGYFTWVVTTPVWDECVVRVSDASDDALCDQSAPFTISGITVTSPNGGEILASGGHANVSWAAASVGGSVEVHYSTNGGASYPNLIGTLPATDGSVAWSVPAVNSTQCRIRVREAGGGGYGDESDADFAVSDGVGSWTPMSEDGTPGLGAVVFWTGSEILVWSGNAGGLYDPGTGSWTPMDLSGAPLGRFGWSAVFTGAELIVWGGSKMISYVNTGAVYDVATDSWTLTGTSGDLPSARGGHTAVWTGTEMIVWGGTGRNGWTDTGARYDPGSGSWTALSTSGAPEARTLHSAVWTGSEMIIWGGIDASGYLDTGGRYDPTSDFWTSTSTADAPTGREYHTVVWTGSEMIVWGGHYCDGTQWVLVNTGGRYDPAGDSWTPTSTVGAPTARQLHTAVPAGATMIVWGGADCVDQYGNTVTETNTGAIYDPALNSWAATSCTGAPGPRSGHVAAWTGSRMIVWGGVGTDGGIYTP